MSNIDEKIKIHVLHTGKVYVDEALPNRDVSRNPIAYTGIFRSLKRRVWIPISVYLIEHPQGLVLFDTGWHTEVRTNPIKHETLLIWFSAKPMLPEGQSVNEQIKALGFKTSDLEYVFLSHLDVDHVSGVRLVKDAKNIMVSEEEKKAGDSRQLRYYKGFWDGVELKPFSWKKMNIGPEHQGLDVFGDGKILLVSTPGHSQGSCSMMIQNHGKFVLLSGDNGYAKDSWEKMRLPGPVYDKTAMIKSLEWVLNMSKKKECMEVLANHDLEVKPHIIEI